MRNFHLFFINASFLCGIILASKGCFKYIPPGVVIVFIILTFALLVLSVNKERAFLFLFVITVFLLGGFRYLAFNVIDGDNIKNYTENTQRKVVVRGEIASDPSNPGKKTTFTLSCASVKTDGTWKNARGLALVKINTGAKKESVKPLFQYGDTVILEGNLRRPYNYGRKTNFDYRKYLADKRIYAILNVKKGFLSEKIGEDRKIKVRIFRAVYSLRAKLQTRIDGFLKEPYSSIAAAILLGKREKLSLSVRDIFVKTGTLHILAISGLHVGIIYFALRIFLKLLRLGTSASLIMSILFLAGYAVLAGARPSILRATTMFSIFALGGILKRKMGIYNLIGLSSLMILGFNPNQLFDLGFILSYTAVLSIVGITPVFYKIFFVDKVMTKDFSAFNKTRYLLLRSVSVSLAAWTGLMPLIAYFFGILSPIVVIANLVVIPLLSMVMVSGILFLSLGFLSNFLAGIFSESAQFFLFIMLRCAGFLKNLPFSYFKINPISIYTVISLYVMILAISVGFHKREKLTFLFLT